VLTAFCADRARFEGEKCFGRRLEGKLSLWLFVAQDVFGSYDFTPPEPLKPDCGALASIVPIESTQTGRYREWYAGALDAFRRSTGETRTMSAAALAMFGEDAVA